MSEIVNTHQAEAWNGYEGRHWAAHHDRYDALNGVFNDTLFAAAAIGPRDRVLDIGCGNGQVTRLAARRARDGHAVGVDLSVPMLDRARALAAEEGVRNVAFERGDAQTHPFGEGAFDVAVSRFGVMFFADPVAAFANVARALRPGGRLAFLCMERLEGSDLGAFFATLLRRLDGERNPTGDDGQGPTSLADPGRVRSLLEAAGFTGVVSERVEADQCLGRDLADAAEFFAGWGPLRFNFGEGETVVAAVAEGLRPFARPDGVWLRGAARLVTADRP
ncbi:class I SAM-dependent methyltransferase [Actinomadura kijaniata]|uniref:SAM-dependent methyltransferase n=1 Tax=Actinomadura namibiensis TaxID=182080 RepID=A0A7W3LWI5_ACTNM|nr:class I SAM-dependent methyltransferase [Actinomadura namibiensis]MBA8955621.1 SAM-dependent methyltransferase [Actinomadura namibiensis]